MAKAQVMDPTVAYMVHYHLGYYHFRNGELRPGLDHMERSVTLHPDFLTAHSSILLALSHADEGDSAISYRQAAERFAEAVRAQIKQAPSDRRPGKTDLAEPADARLRVGFLSGDLFRHPVAYFLEDVLRHLDKTHLHLVAYSNNPLDDEVTASLTTLFDEWHSIRSLTDDAAAELISSHRIDVLLDLSGHTGENRLAVFARRPAPVQVSWLGYFASTGLPEMDYIIGDPASTPVETSEWFSEKVYRMPQTRLCMSTPRPLGDIAVQSPPCLRNGYITFGSYQQATKITPRVLAVWAQALQAVPQSRLRIQTAAIDTPSMRDRLVQDMQQAGIDLARVTLLGAYGFERYLASHNEVDILLDTFPYPGGTTTAFALWMGVPTITLAGNTMLSRQGASMLQCVGLTNWIAQSESEYIDLCRRMASAPTTLAALRAELREQALKSPLFDSESFAKDLQAALLRMSRRTDA
jgi:predicted O-linked N-acetylglucosamine transferase (SPINDLY family)